MSVVLLRHVAAGDRSAWSGDDRHRPADDRGRAQATALVDRLTALGGIVAVHSSPYRRCLDSVEPLATAVGVPVETVDELAEGSPPDVVERLLRAAAREAAATDGVVVLCSHGDVIGDVVLRWARAGVLGGAEPRWPKASAWVVDDLLDRPQVRFLPRPG